MNPKEKAEEVLCSSCPRNIRSDDCRCAAFERDRKFILAGMEEMALLAASRATIGSRDEQYYVDIAQRCREAMK